MTRWNRLIPSLVFICLLAGSCGASKPLGEPSSPGQANPTRSIAVSVPASSIYLLDPATQQVRTEVRGLTDFQAGYAAWSPDHRHLAYGDNAIVTVDTLTGRPSVLVRGPSLSMPAWSPDGLRIAYGDGRDLWVSPASKVAATYLQLPLSLAPLDMDWGRSGLIAFQGLRLECHVPLGCSSTNSSDLWTVRPDGTGLKQLTNVGDVSAPRWSPDGRRIVFVRRSGAEGPGQLWSVAADGTGAARLVAGKDVLGGDWSPDSRQIAVVATGPLPKTLRVWIGSADGRGLRAVGPIIRGAQASIDW